MENDPVNIPVDGCLDLHTFAPSEAGDLVEDYIEACLLEGIFEVRFIHGKGKGALRETVHARLRRSPHVLRFALDAGPSGWGATVVWLKERRLEASKGKEGADDE